MGSKKQDRAYQAEHYDEYIDLMAGINLSSIEIDEETWGYLGIIADHYQITRRQALSNSVNNAIEAEENKKECTCDWVHVCPRPKCQKLMEEEYERERRRATRIKEDYFHDSYTWPSK